jgi:Uma2 family endonuclease
MIAIPSGFSAQEYLALERENAIRHEYRQGLVYAMAGGSDDHSRLSINFLMALHRHLRGSHCQFFSGDVKVNYAEAFFYYPDAFVTCDLRDLKDHYVKRYPKLIAEVLSPSTEQFDRTDKFHDYQNLDTFNEYVLISQSEMRVECRRAPSNDSLENRNRNWQTEIYGKGEQIALKSIGLTISIEDLYLDIALSG